MDATFDDFENVVVDVFAARATPELRRARPALFRLRTRWAEARLREEAGALRSCGGIAIGERVRVEVRPGVYRYGVVLAWDKASSLSSRVLLSQTLASVRLDPPLDGCGADIRQVPRWRLAPGGPEPAREPLLTARDDFPLLPPA